MNHMAIKLDRASGSCWRGIFGPRFRLLISATAVLFTPFGLGIAPMSIVAMAQQSQLPSCDLKSVNWDNCQGSRQYPDGVYVGEFRNGGLNGQGTLTYANGQKYVGEFRDNKFNGQGTATHPDGTKYVGGFRDDKFDGQGTLTFPGGKYVGEFRDNKPEGQGTLTYPDGRKFVGEFRNGALNGQGTATFPDVGKYVGEFRDNKFDGLGTFYAAGTSISGIWANGKFVARLPVKN